MPQGSAHDSEAILAAARNALADQRAGGRRTGSIGRSSRALKRQHLARKLIAILIAIGLILTGAAIAGWVVNGIGWGGLLLTVLALVIAVGVLARYPRMKVPTQASLAKGSLRQLVGRTELWLESQRRALPAPAAQLVDHIGLQLDALGVQLERVGEEQPAAADIRKLVGEHLPELVSTYTAIPAHLRSGQPDAQLSESLTRISGEIDSATRQLASGAMDRLAIQTRYLDYKYGEGMADDS